jgi:3',5'-cyclic AMP phosphodiesterase CpdA
VVLALLVVSLGTAFALRVDRGRTDLAPSAGHAPTSDPSPVSASGESVTVVAVGDIAKVAADGRATSRLVASIDPDALLVLGDAAYDEGSTADYARAYDPGWGRFVPITRPVPGNHDYETPGGAGYFAYFADVVHGRRYYAWDAGSWRMYALNCEIACGARSRQLTWLRADLAAHPRTPAVAYLHEPLFTCSTGHPPDLRLRAVWRALQRYGGRLLLSGHNHAYERFAPQDAGGNLDPDGLRQLVVGTGGAEAYPLRRTCAHRRAGVDGHDGVLVLRLRPDGWSWRFVGTGGRVLDRGSATL